MYRYSVVHSGGIWAGVDHAPSAVSAAGNVCSPHYTAGVAKHDQLVVSGAREHNLKDISLSLPRDALVVLPGLSGSGKWSLAFGTIYADGQRRCVESMSA